VVIVHRLGSVGAARYYLAAVGRDGGDAPLVGEAPGRWAGGRAPGGPVDATALAGCMPAGPGRVPGLDVMFSAPKSVSVLHALGDDELAAAVRRAHDDAVAAGFAYLERHACRVKARGRVVAADGFVAAAFRHRTSRADDPHLHTHVVVANCAWGPDGQRRALHTPALYAERRGAGATYHLVLRGSLTASVGVRWAPPTMGRADVLEVPDEVRAGFSRRRAAVLDASASVRERRWAEHATRPARDGLVDYESLQFGWRRRAAFLGWSPPAARSVPRPLVLAPVGEDVLPTADRWSRGDVVVALAGRWRDGADRASVEQTTERLLGSGAVLARGAGFTTPVADARARRVAAVVAACPTVATAPEAVRALQCDGRRVVVVVPDAATAQLTAARTGVTAVAVADAPPAVAVLGPRDVVVVLSAPRLPSLALERVVSVAAHRGAAVVRGDPLLPPPPRPTLAAGTHLGPAPRTVAVRGGDVTVAAYPGEAADLALGDWLARRRSGEDAVLVAEHAEVRGLNARAREALRACGALGRTDVQGFAVGDVVWFTHARPSLAIARYASGEVTAVSLREVEVRLARDERVVHLRATELRGAAHAHVVPPVPALIAGRGDVFVVGGRTFAERHLAGAHLHRYLTGSPALDLARLPAPRAADGARAALHAGRAAPDGGRLPPDGGRAPAPPAHPTARGPVPPSRGTARVAGHPIASPAAARDAGRSR
jgi:conjugative relaxase-like TrwC/TraI family protein